ECPDQVADQLLRTAGNLAETDQALVGSYLHQHDLIALHAFMRSPARLRIGGRQGMSAYFSDFHERASPSHAASARGAGQLKISPRRRIEPSTLSCGSPGHCTRMTKWLTPSLSCQRAISSFTETRSPMMKRSRAISSKLMLAVGLSMPHAA